MKQSRISKLFLKLMKEEVTYHNFLSIFLSILLYLSSFNVKSFFESYYKVSFWVDLFGVSESVKFPVNANNF